MNILQVLENIGVSSDEFLGSHLIMHIIKLR